MTNKKILIGRIVYEAEQRCGVPLETLIKYEINTPNASVARKLGVSRQIYGKWKEMVLEKEKKKPRRKD